MIRRLFAFVLVVACADDVFGYGNAGHQAIGMIAEKYLDGSRALEEVRKLLHKDEGLDRAATWMDRAKLPDKYLTNEMKELVANNPDNHSFHYCDVPFQQKVYKDGVTGTNPHDIVHVMQLCIHVLQAPDDNGDNPLKIHKRVALMMLAHLVGDLHQPLHVGCSYVDADNHFVDPDSGAKDQEDAGANYFHIKNRKGTVLHGYWDTQTVKLARDHLLKKVPPAEDAAPEDTPSKDPSVEVVAVRDFSAALMKAHPKEPAWNGKGPVDTWPVQWATETLGLSKMCFDGITPGDRFFVEKEDKHPDREAHFEWVITLPDNYPDKSRDVVEVELSKAGYRLAALLKTIWPDKK